MRRIWRGVYANARDILELTEEQANKLFLSVGGNLRAGDGRRGGLELGRELMIRQEEPCFT